MRLLFSCGSWDVGSVVGPVVQVRVPAGARIVHEGQATGTFFVIAEGEAELRSRERSVGKLTAGDFFGAIDAASAGPQSLTIIATSPVRLVTIAAAGMGRLCDAIPGLRAHLQAALSHQFAPAGGSLAGGAPTLKPGFAAPAQT
jgi:CRP-like cAMP-binding protein